MDSDATVTIRPLSTRLGTRTAPFLFLLMECDRPAEGGECLSLEDVDEIVVGRGSVRECARSSDGRVLEWRVPDPRLSTRHARLFRQGGGFRFEDLGSKNGSVVDGVRQSQIAVRDWTLIEFGYTVFLFRQALPV